MFLDIIVGELEDCSQSKSRIFEQLFSSILLIQDDESNVLYRIRNYISSFKYNSIDCSSGPLLKSAKSSSKPLRLVSFVLKLSSKSDALYEFLSSSRDIFWIIDVYESLIEEEFSNFIGDDLLIEEDINRGYHNLFLTEDIPIELKELEKWRQSKLYFGLLFAHSIVRQRRLNKSYDLIMDSNSLEIASLKSNLVTTKK